MVEDGSREKPMKRIVFLILLIGVGLVHGNNWVVPVVGNIDHVRMDNTEDPLRSGDGRFAGADTSLDRSLSEYASQTWKFLFGGNDRTPNRKLPVQPVDLAHFNRPGSGQLNAIWLGHSSLMINMDGYRILTDPVFPKSVTPVGPSRFNGEVPVDVHRLSEIDVVVISHDHYDHLNRYSIRTLREKAKRFFVPTGVGGRIEKWGVPKEKIVELAWWEEYRFDENLKLAATPAQHFSGRGLTDRNRTLWASWVIQTVRHNVFFSGDSGYFDGFRKIGESYGPFDMTFMECGAYDAAWRQLHMFPEQTVQAHLDLKGKILHPIHWGTFNLAHHAWYDPMERLTVAAARWRIPVATPVVGETTRFGIHVPSEPWWKYTLARNNTLPPTGEASY